MEMKYSLLMTMDKKIIVSINDIYGNESVFIVKGKDYLWVVYIIIS